MSENYVLFFMGLLVTLAGFLLKIFIDTLRKNDMALIENVEELKDEMNGLKRDLEILTTAVIDDRKSLSILKIRFEGFSAKFEDFIRKFDEWTLSHKNKTK